MHIVRNRPINAARRVYLPHERRMVTANGLGELHGFNVGKMFKRMFKFTPSSFKLKNVMGAIGSTAAFTATMGLSSTLAPKTFSAHSKAMKALGTGIVATGAVVGAGYAASAMMPAGTSLWGGLKTVGSGLMNVVSGASKALPLAGKLFGGGGGGGQLDIPQQQVMMLPPVQQQDMYGAGVPVSNQLVPTAYPTMSDPSQGYAAYSPATDMRTASPYSALTETDGSVQVDPSTGQVLPMMETPVAQAGMFPELSTQTWLIIGGATLVGMFIFSGKKTE